MQVIKKNNTNTIYSDNMSYSNVMVIIKHIYRGDYHVFTTNSNTDSRFSTFTIIDDDDRDADIVLKYGDPLYGTSVNIYDSNVINLTRGECDIILTDNVFNDLIDIENNIKDIIDEIENVSQSLMYESYIKFEFDWLVVK